MSPDQVLWESTHPPMRSFDVDTTAGLPMPVQSYLQHAIQPGSPLFSSVRLKMSGEIKLKEWTHFTAKQVIQKDKGFVWRAVAGHISGFDQLYLHKGLALWKIFGMFPVMRADGWDTTRSAQGRMAAESIWLPSTLCDLTTRWGVVGPNHISADVITDSVESHLNIDVADSGRVQGVNLPRWGNPTKGGYAFTPFVVRSEEEGTFDGYTIPTRLRAGWQVGPQTFEEGEFFRCQVETAEFR